jgi:hypothetical protein
MGTYSIEIFDQNNKKIGELPTATSSEILQFINKGFIVIDRMTGNRMTESSITSTIGVSDGLINVG